MVIITSIWKERTDRILTCLTTDMASLMKSITMQMTTRQMALSLA